MRARPGFGPGLGPGFGLRHGSGVAVGFRELRGDHVLELLAAQHVASLRDAAAAASAPGHAASAATAAAAAGRLGFAAAAAAAGFDVAGAGRGAARRAEMQEARHLGTRSEALPCSRSLRERLHATPPAVARGAAEAGGGGQRRARGGSGGPWRGSSWAEAGLMVPLLGLLPAPSGLM